MILKRRNTAIYYVQKKNNFIATSSADFLFSSSIDKKAFLRER
jgi:hypothetical protein